MTPTATTYAAQRRSLWAGTSPLSASFPSTSSRSSVYSVDKQDFLKLQRRNTIMHTPAFLEKLQEFDFRPRSNSRSSKESSEDCEATPRPGPLRRMTSTPLNRLLDSTTPKAQKSRLSAHMGGGGRVVSSFKDRLLKRKTSAPLLSLSTEKARSFKESPTTPTGSNVCWSPTAGDLMEGSSSFSSSPSSSRPFVRRKLSTVLDESAEVVTSLRRNRKASGSKVTKAIDLGTVGYPFYQINRLAHKAGMYLNPYPRSAAPYMLSYNKMQLECERYNDLLFRRLNKYNSPSFHDYNLHPPSRVLDLGCGRGCWISNALETWGRRGTMVTGLDLVDNIDREVKEARGFSWYGGNFVAYELPFADDTFDMVRMSNLTLCIPRERWEHVLSETRRVLKPNGRVEVIDDQLMFPYLGTQTTSPTMTSSSPESSSQTSRTSWDGSVNSASSGESSGAERRPSADLSPSFLNLELESDVYSISTDSTPGLYSGDSHSDSSCEDLLRTPVDEHATLSWNMPDTPSLVQFHEREEAQCRDIEGIFVSMLNTTYGIDSQPHEFFLSLLKQVFGPQGRARKIEAFHLSMLNPEVHDRVVGGKEKRKWESTLGRESSLRRTPTAYKVPTETAVNTKAAKLLGIDQSDVEHGSPPHSNKFSLKRPIRPRTSSKRSTSSLKPAPPEPLLVSSRTITPDFILREDDSHQPSGLLVYPDRFLDMSPRELEMHLTKDMHTVIGCKVALSDFVANLKDAKGVPLVSEADWDDMAWEYECSRRKRFNLPFDERGFDLENYDDDSELSQDPFEYPLMRPRKVMLPLLKKKPGREAAFSDLDFDLEESSSIPMGTPVRSIRVFEAYKIDIPQGSSA